MYSEFQYSLGSDCKSNYLQKFDNYILYIIFLINKNNSDSYLCV